MLLILNDHVFGAESEMKNSNDKRMDWWREARFGMFIHWGLYAIPAGEWETGTNHAEWIRTTAEIPLEQYDKFVEDFNPVNFNADDWVRMGKWKGIRKDIFDNNLNIELFDLDKDKQEQNNLAAKFPDVIKKIEIIMQKEHIPAILDRFKIAQLGDY